MPSRTISTRIAVEGEAKYKAALSDVNATLSRFKAEMDLATVSAAKNGNSIESLNALLTAQQNAFAQNETKISLMAEAMKNCQEAEASYREQLQAVEAAIAANNEALANGTIGADEHAAKDKELGRQKEELTAKMQAAARGAEQWGKKIAESTSEQVKLGSSIKDTSKSIEEQGSKMKTALKSFGLLDAQVITGKMHSVASHLADSLQDCISGFISFESAMAGVAKTTDMSDSELKAMGDSIKELTTQIPITAVELASVVEAAGQLGIAKENLLDFATAMSNLGVATNLTSTEAATMLAQFANITGMSANDFDRLGSTVVALGNNMATTERDIVELSQRLAAGGKLAGLTESQIMALSAAMASVGISAEAGGTAMTQTLTKLEKAVTNGGDSLEKIAELAGMTAEEFAAAWKGSPIKAIEAFITGLGNLENEGESATLVLEELGMSGIRQSNMLKSLGNAAGLLTSALEIADTAWSENAALATEAATRYATTESQITMLQNSFSNLKMAIGEQLAPAFKQLVSAGLDVTSALNSIVQENTWLGPALAGAATAVATMTTALTVMVAVAQAAKIATKLLGESLKTVPFVAVASAIMGIVAALTTYAEAQLSTTNDIKKSSAEIIDAVTEINSAYNNTRENANASAAASTTLAKRLAELSGSYTGTAAEAAEMASICKMLNSSVDGLNVAFDAETGAINMTTEAMMAYITAARLRAQADAAMEAYTDSLKKRYEAERVLNEARANYDQYDPNNTWAWDAVKQQQAANAVAKAETAYSEASTAVEYYGQIVEETSLAVAESNAALETNAETTEASVDTSTQALKELEEAYKNLKESALKSLDSVFSRWEKAETVQATSANTLRDNVKSQQEYFQNYSDNLTNLMSRPIEGIAEFAAQFTDGSAESAAALAGLAAASDEEVQNIIDSMASLDTVKESLAEQFADIETGGLGEVAKEAAEVTEATTEAKAAASELPQTAEAAVQSTVEQVKAVEKQANSAAREVGSQISQGIAAGIIGGIGPVAAAAQAVVNAAIAAAKAAADSHSPSRKFAQIGRWMDEGLVVGIQDEADLAAEAMRRTIDNVVDVANRGSALVDRTVRGGGPGESKSRRSKADGGAGGVTITQNIYAENTSYAEQQRRAAKEFRQIARALG